MNARKYERDGKYAARSDCELSPMYLLQNIRETYSAVAEPYKTGNMCAESFNWVCDYIETGLKLWDCNRAAALVRKNFGLSAITYAEEFNQTPNDELDRRLERLSRIKA